MHKVMRATPDQIVRNGHISILIKTYLQREGIKPPDLSQKLGMDRHRSNVYLWLAGKVAPAGKTRIKLAKILNVPEEQLMPNTSNIAVITAPGRQELLPKEFKPREVLGFSVNSNGEATINLNVTMPLDQAQALFRIILDANLLVR
jgi:transcriptional regulator with XRE-family HTH domain